jgi:hypothetical protein
MSSRILDLTSALIAAGPTAVRRDVRLSMNSLEATSAKKWDPPFLKQVSVSCAGSATCIIWVDGRTYVQCAELRVGIPVADASFERPHGLFWLHRLGSNDIGDLEVERDIFPAKRPVLASYRVDGAM